MRALGSMKPLAMAGGQAHAVTETIFPTVAAGDQALQ